MGPVWPVGVGVSRSARRGTGVGVGPLPAEMGVAVTRLSPGRVVGVGVGVSVGVGVLVGVEVGVGVGGVPQELPPAGQSVKFPLPSTATAWSVPPAGKVSDAVQTPGELCVAATALELP